MAFPHRAMSLSPRRFYEYLDGLQEEFGLLSNAKSTKSSMAHRFNIYLGGLKGEFKLIALENESLRKERDGYREKGT